MDFLSHQNKEVVNQTLWALGNIVGDCAIYRDLLINHSVIQTVDYLLYRVRIHD